MEASQVQEFWQEVALQHPEVADFLCPLTGQLMEEPVVAEDGFNYERKEITLWLEKEKVSPQTGEPMGSKLRPNDKLRSVTKSFLDFSSNGLEGPVELSWDAHGRRADLKRGGRELQLLKTLRCSGRGGATMAQKLSHPFRKLDPMRETLAETLDGFLPPRIVVVGGESVGKSSILEQLAKQPLLPRRRVFCTRVAIHLRLRRSPAECSVTMSVYKVTTGGEVLEKGPERIPQENGWRWVEKEMSRLVEESKSESSTGAHHIVDAKILVLEVRRPEVPSIDLVDLPGVVTHPPAKEAAVLGILDKHLEGNQCNMPMLIVEASALPTNSPATRYIMQKGLQDKTVGVFSKCDLSPDHDALRARILHEKSKKGGESPEDLGGVRLKCWVASMQGPEKQGQELPEEYQTHNFERVWRQQKIESAYFANIPELMDLQELGNAGIGSLAEQLDKEYQNHLHRCWKWPAGFKLEAKLDQAQFDLSMLGVVPESQKQELAAAEVIRRLGSSSPFTRVLYQSFVKEVLQDKLYQRTCDALLDFQAGGCMCEGHQQQSVIDRACVQIREIMDEALQAVRDRFVEAVREILHTESKVANGAEHVNIVTEGPAHLDLSPLRAFAEDQRWKRVQQALKDQPMIQLSSYATYTDAIMARFEQLYADATGRLTEKCEELLKRLADLDAPCPWLQVQARFEPQGAQNSRSKVVMFCKVEEFATAAYALFLRHIPSQDHLARLHEGLPVGKENADIRLKVDCLREQMVKLQEAQSGIREALSIDDAEFAEIQQKYEAAAMLQPPGVAPTPESLTEDTTSSGEDSEGASSSWEKVTAEPLKVHWKTAANSFEVEIQSEATAAELKELISKRLEEPAKQLKLVYKGSNVDDGTFMKDVGIAGDEFIVVAKAPEEAEVPTRPVGLFFYPKLSLDGMLKEAQRIPAAKKMIEKSIDILGYNILDDLSLLRKPEVLHELTRLTEVTFLTGLTCLEKLKQDDREVVTRTRLVAGTCGGQIAALCAAEVMCYTDGLKLTKLCKEAMMEVFESAAKKHSVLQVCGLQRDQLHKLCCEASLKEEGEVCSIAAFTSDDIVCAGTDEAVTILKDSLERSGTAVQEPRAFPAIFTSLMEPAQDKLNIMMEEMLPNMQPPAHAVLVGTRSLPRGTPPEELVSSCKRLLTSPMIFPDIKDAMLREGVKELYMTGEMSKKSVHGFDIVRDMCKFADSATSDEK